MDHEPPPSPDVERRSADTPGHVELVATASFPPHDPAVPDPPKQEGVDLELMQGSQLEEDVDAASRSSSMLSGTTATLHDQDHDGVKIPPNSNGHLTSPTLSTNTTDDEDENIASSPRHADEEVPPFWSPRQYHGRTISTVSYHSIIEQTACNPIRLEDRSHETHSAAQGCWAQSVSLHDYTVVSGSTGIGAYIVWTITIRTLYGGDIELNKRYSEFDQLRADLVASFPGAEAMIPKLPRKSVVSRFRPKFLDQRKAGLQQFLNCILLNPEFAASPVVKEFVFS
ncbi:PX domain-containing protein ypt35 [Elasticomyces elasticus]|nr:PX domain-containing protein ypt35 [Elasticomyces elasticus]KAK3663019.1 PX domain-containing protein ypt35 [Elasticomyces elasticus]KAK4914503.1 PX domain-containing protein ypt35 [Elasticomyces elasticus]KAK5753503.1 PX domain-containing protein ypt35 [Elasticomyces elasticus]